MTVIFTFIDDVRGSIVYDADPAVDSRTGLSNQIDLCPDSCCLSGTTTRKGV